MNSQNQQQIASFLDFDNVVGAVAPGEHGATKVSSIMRYFQKRGTLSIRRAYGNWRRVYINRDTDMKRYRWQELVESGLDLIQVFPVNELKNRADINIAVDAIEIALSRPDIHIYVIISGDSDFGPLVNKLRTLGRYVIGVISHARPINPTVLKMYDEVVFIEDILNPIGGKGDCQNHVGRLIMPNDQGNNAASNSANRTMTQQKAQDGDLAEARQSARQLLSHVLRKLFALPRPPIQAGQLKMEMCKVDGAFDPRKLRYRNFEHWLLVNRDLMTLLRKDQGANAIYVIPLGHAVPDEFELRSDTDTMAQNNSMPDDAPAATDENGLETGN